MAIRRTDHLSLVDSTMAYGDETPPLIERSHLHYLSFRMDGIADLCENDKTHLGKLI